MGTDIHLIVEHRNEDGAWHRVPHFDRPCEDCEGTGRRGNKECSYCHGAGHYIQPHYDWRNYDVFAMLANVRNGYGFAGVDTGNGFLPLSSGRGIPTDLCEETRAELNGAEEVPWPDHNDPNRYDHPWYYDLGEHSQTWLLWSELQDEHYWARTTKRRGVVGPWEFCRWKFTGRPDSWSGGIAGGGVENVSNEEMATFILSGEAAKSDRRVYTQVEWVVTYAEQAGRFLERIAATVAHIGDPAPNDVRLTMGFDS